MTLACKDANKKLVEVLTVADLDADKGVHNSLVEIWKLKFGLTQYSILGPVVPLAMFLFTINPVNDKFQLKVSTLPLWILTISYLVGQK